MINTFQLIKMSS